MKTVKNETTASLREKGSKFIGYLYPAESIEAFEVKLEQIKSKYPDATHHCYAYRFDPNDLQEFAQDDGEPGGTAGLPILNQLKSYGVVNAAAIIVRYFGGTKLGKSGLIQAYGKAASLCLEKAKLADVRRTVNFKLTYSYDQQNRIDQLKSNLDLVELDSEYLEKVTLVLACPLDRYETLSEILDRLEHLGIRFKEQGESFISG